MPPGTMITIAVFLMTTSLVMIIGLLLTRGSDRLSNRIGVLAGRQTAEPEGVVHMARMALPKMGEALTPGDEDERSKLRARLIHAGLYNKQAMHVFLGFKLLTMTVLPLIALIGVYTHLLPTTKGLIGAVALFIVGMIGPSFWLDKKKKKRQTMFRRSLPDALDVLVICLQGGLSLPASLKRVAMELKTVHRILSNELLIVDREIQLGRTAGEALRYMADRTGLEEIVDLSSVINQSDRFGASLVNALKVHADTLRLRRQQKAEEKAQQAGTKILIPTLLFIFPAIFVVILGPAAYKISAMLGQSSGLP